ncbi:MAG: TonB-dependent receptor plug domain-containing protein [Cytophagales bacterium]|nr:TonB-dependent receptor plug domain-containing protein [Cytophagales bacterium]
MTKNISLCLLLYAIGATVQAQDLDSLLQLKAYTEESALQKEINKGTTLASAKALSQRESPGILSVISREEIQAMGARDLVDILRTIPGYDVAQDVNHIQGVAIRGNWSNEGKLLLLVDGQTYNDLNYQSVPIGNKFPVDLIERIEVIRGPGSTIYGGTAEYGVIHIITKNASMKNGVLVNLNQGAYASGLSRSTVGLALARSGHGWRSDLGLHYAQAPLSDGKYTSFYGDTTTSLLRTSLTEAFNLNYGLQLGRLNMRMIYDDYQSREPQNQIGFGNFYGELRYDLPLTDRLIFTPRINYSRQLPWTVYNLAANDYEIKTRAERLQGSLDIGFDLSKKIHFNTGFVAYVDQANDLLAASLFHYYNLGLYAQGLLRYRLANVTLGARLEHNQYAGPSFVPRLGLTKKVENLHFKLLLSRSFRAPGLQNILLADTAQSSIRPERSTVLEGEIGYQFSPEMIVSLNAYRIETRDILIYNYVEFSDESFYEFYNNSRWAGTQGLELQAAYKAGTKLSMTASYSYYQRLAYQTVSNYEVPEKPLLNLALPAHKVNASLTYLPVSWLSLHLGLVWASERWAFTQSQEVPLLDEQGQPVVNDEGEAEVEYQGRLTKLDPVPAGAEFCALPTRLDAGNESRLGRL